MTSLQLRTFAVFTLGYFFSYLFRGVNLGFAPFLLSDVKLTATDLGVLTSVYFLGFAGAQIPGGVLLDRFGPRRVTAYVLLVAGFGSLIFGISQSLMSLMIARFLIGVGSSVCLGGAFKATAQHFSSARLTLMNGLVMAIGALGGVVIGAPLAWLLTLASWRTLSFWIAAATVCVSAIILLAGPGSERSGARVGMLEQFRGTWHVLGSLKFWHTATLSAMTLAVFFTMQSLWVSPFLRDVVPQGAEHDSARVATLVSVLGAGFIVGNIGFGALAESLKRRGISVRWFSGVTMLLFIIVQILLTLRVALPETFIWAAYGALGGTGVLTYSVLADMFPSHLIGRVNTTFNLVLFATVFVAQAAIGLALGRWSLDGGRWPEVAHQAIWTVLIVVQSAAALWYFAPLRSSRRDTAVL
ncbi:MFS transporter [Caballeronia insecticola]|uniref:Major facilitator superfamily MFS_1 n=1 Tax=Caballeronia insecticola TaxID=758793 RepID=R4X1L2_9BURK|nr:MFS transporter [Caballeronia insecticola]BAN28250.1 major facilitator superfamily MFS_1 [Caballeronia insecticola]